MEFIAAISSDDGETLRTKGHFGDAGYFLLYRITPGGTEFLKKIRNPKYQENPASPHGDPVKAVKISELLRGAAALVSVEFGPNIVKMLKNFPCVVVRTASLAGALSLLRSAAGEIAARAAQGEGRKALVLKE